MKLPAESVKMSAFIYKKDRASMDSSLQENLNPFDSVTLLSADLILALRRVNSPVQMVKPASC